VHTSAESTSRITRIANALGVPGTSGCFGRLLHDGQLVLISTHHVLFGAGAAEQSPVWLLGNRELDMPRLIGHVSHGRRGVVHFKGAAIYVDCAAAATDERLMPAGSRIGGARFRCATELAGGDRVSVSGIAGKTEGVVARVDSTELVRIDGRVREAPGQIAIRSVVSGALFSNEGDSGAVVCDATGAIVGLLWGRNASGESIACPIEPVLWVLHARPVRLVSRQFSCPMPLPNAATNR
jgi:hypothetical protein